jgi:hypothetical protein
MKMQPKPVSEYLGEVERAIASLRLTPQPQDERLEELRQQYEMVLVQLESCFLVGIAPVIGANLMTFSLCSVTQNPHDIT